ncbi:MAG: hypothetical protein OEV28_02695, partial [Nitrospirota bacterium]|nr:hypothetical protein [Nitrospirota bacterium]
IDKKGWIWICEQKGNRLAAFNPVNETFSEFDPATKEGQPFDLTFDAKGILWFVDALTGQVGKLDASKIQTDESSMSIRFTPPRNLFKRD